MEPTLENRFKKIMEDLSGKHRGTPAQRKELFDIHNLLWPNRREHNSNCSSCIARVYKKMIEQYSKMKEDGRSN